MFTSPGNQKQRWLPGVDPVLPGHVLFLSPLPGLVRQLTQLASTDSILQETGTGTYWLSHKDVMTPLRLNVQFYCAGPGVQSALHEDSSRDGSLFFPDANYLLMFVHGSFNVLEHF